MEDGNIMATKPKSKVWLWVLLAVIVIAAAAYVLFKYVIKDNVEPSGPSSADSSATTAEDNESEKTLSLLRDQYNWSTMQSGPYRDKVSFATSSDLLNWTDSGQVLAEHASVPDAVYKDGVIYIYFVDVSTDKKPEQIGMVKSTDLGKTWEPRQITKINGIGAMAPADPSPVLLDDGRIRLFFFDINRDRIEMAKNPPAKKPEGEKP